MIRHARTVLPLALCSAAAVALAACGGDGASSASSGTTSSISAAINSTASTAGSPATATSSAAVSPPAPGGAGVSQQQAEQIALSAAGPGSSVVKTEADDEDGRAVWKVDLLVNGQKLKIEVDRTTGAVVKNEAGD